MVGRSTLPKCASKGLRRQLVHPQAIYAQSFLPFKCGGLEQPTVVPSPRAVLALLRREETDGELERAGKLPERYAAISLARQPALAQFATVSSSVAENKYLWCAGTPGLGSGNLVPFDFLVHRRAVDVEHRSRRFYVAARVLQGRRDEQSLKLLECRADRGEPDRTRLRWRGIDAIRKGVRITARGGDFDIGRFRPRVTT